MSSTSSDGASGVGSGSEGTSFSKMYVNLDFASDNADSVLNSILVRHLTPSELRGMPIGMRPPSPVLPKKSATLNPQDKDKTGQQPQRQKYQAGSSTKVTNTTSPISSCCQHNNTHTSPKKPKVSPVSIAPPILSSESDSEILNHPLAGSSQASCSAKLNLAAEIFNNLNSQPSPTQLRRLDYQNRADQRRRNKVKVCFEKLHNLIPHLREDNMPLNNAKMLRKSAKYIKNLCNERNVLKDRIEALEKERDNLNNSLKYFYCVLPIIDSGQSFDHVRQLYEQHVRSRTKDNWKYWILGLVLEPLLISYNSNVSSGILDDVGNTALLWVDNSYSLIDLRTAISNKLKYLSMKTDILSEPPSTLKEEVAKALDNKIGEHPNLFGT